MQRGRHTPCLLSYKLAENNRKNILYNYQISYALFTFQQHLNSQFRILFWDAYIYKVFVQSFCHSCNRNDYEIHKN